MTKKTKPKIESSDSIETVTKPDSESVQVRAIRISNQLCCNVTALRFAPPLIAGQK